MIEKEVVNPETNGKIEKEEVVNPETKVRFPAKKQVKK